MRHGFGMIEMMVAISILTTALIAAVSLSTLTLMTAKQAEFRLVAVNLAREGIEVVRNIRDSNRLANVANPLDAGLVSGTDYTAVPVFAAGFWTLDFAPNSIVDVGAQVISVNGTSLPFRRLLTLDEICEDGSVVASGGACTGANPKVGIRVTARVQAQAAGSAGAATVIEDRLYAWQ